jgi:hypothetical protein
MLHRRGIVFAHRDLDVVLGCIEGNEPFGVLTGLMPSGRMHLGHSMVIDQVRWFQEQGADITVTVADLDVCWLRRQKNNSRRNGYYTGWSCHKWIPEEKSIGAPFPTVHG